MGANKRRLFQIEAETFQKQTRKVAGVSVGQSVRLFVCLSGISCKLHQRPNSTKWRQWDAL